MTVYLSTEWIINKNEVIYERMLFLVVLDRNQKGYLIIIKENFWKEFKNDIVTCMALLLI